MWDEITSRSPKKLCHHWSLEMNTNIHQLTYWPRDYLSLQGLKLIHDIKKGPSSLDKTRVRSLIVASVWCLNHPEENVINDEGFSLDVLSLFIFSFITQVFLSNDITLFCYCYTTEVPFTVIFRRRSLYSFKFKKTLLIKHPTRTTH